MTKIHTQEAQLVECTSLLRKISDQIIIGLNILKENIDNYNQEELLNLISIDAEVLKIERKINNLVLQMLATQQPMARNLRLAYSTPKIARHLELITNALKNIACKLAATPLTYFNSNISSLISTYTFLFSKIYDTIFENDLNNLRNIELQEDKIRDTSREIVLNAKKLLLQINNSKTTRDSAILLLEITSKFEYITDLLIDWVSEIDFIEHGNARTTLPKRKTRIAFLDNTGGITASIAASFTNQITQNMVETLVLTSSSNNCSILSLSNELTKLDINLQIFPIAKIGPAKWNKVFTLIILGELEFTEEFKEVIPDQTVTLAWRDIDLHQLFTESTQGNNHDIIINNPLEFNRIIAQLKENVQNICTLVARL